MELASHNIQERLPYSAQLEWLQSSGTQWIDTGAFVDEGDIELEFCMTHVSQSGSLFGYNVYGTWQGHSVSGLRCGCGMQVYDYKFRYIAAGNINEFSKYPCDTQWHTFAVKQNTMRLDDEIMQFNGNCTMLDGVKIDTFTLFGYRKDGVIATNNFPQRVKCFTQTGLHDMIPVRVGTIGYMYDRISGKLFGNQGSGDFILGPDADRRSF